MLRIIIQSITLLLLIFNISCNHATESGPLDHVKDLMVKDVLQKGMSSAGGIENYLSIDSVVYRKRTVLYLEDGQIESELDQLHRYKLQPEVSGMITWKDSINSHGVYYSQHESYKTMNGVKIEDSSESAKQSFYSSYYVLFLPFKLMDAGVSLSHEGVTELGAGKKADVIKATYNPQEHGNHSTSDEWFFYFDKEDGRVLANLVHHPPTYAFIENTETTETFPLRMNLYRQTWRTDKDRNKKYLRGEFWYNDYKFTSIDK